MASSVSKFIEFAEDILHETEICSLDYVLFWFHLSSKMKKEFVDIKSFLGSFVQTCSYQSR